MAMFKIVGGDRQEYGPVTEEALRQWIAEGRANGETLVQAEGGVWKRLATYPEFAEALRGAAPSPPPIAPGPIGGPVPSMAVPVDGRSRVQGPAIGLIVIGLIGLPLGLLGLAGHLVDGSFGLPEGMGDAELRRLFEVFSGGLGTAVYLVQVLLSAVILAGGIRLLALKNYGLVVVAAILAILPCVSPCCCLGIPVGIWVLVVVAKPEVKALFS